MLKLFIKSERATPSGMRYECMYTFELDPTTWLTANMCIDLNRLIGHADDAILEARDDSGAVIGRTSLLNPRGRLEYNGGSGIFEGLQSNYNDKAADMVQQALHATNRYLRGNAQMLPKEEYHRRR